MDRLIFILDLINLLQQPRQNRKLNFTRILRHVVQIWNFFVVIACVSICHILHPTASFHSVEFSCVQYMNVHVYSCPALLDWSNMLVRSRRQNIVINFMFCNWIHMRLYCTDLAIQKTWYYCCLLLWCSKIAKNGRWAWFGHWTHSSSMLERIQLLWKEYIYGGSARSGSTKPTHDIILLHLWDRGPKESLKLPPQIDQDLR
jgi:hypothetical protein